jgi:hypothetical protein
MTDGAKVRIFWVVLAGVVAIWLAYCWSLLARGEVPSSLGWAFTLAMAAFVASVFWTTDARSSERARRRTERQAAQGSTNE